MPASRKARWSELEFEDVRPGVRRAGFGTGNVQLVMNELRPGMQTRPHSHDFDQIAMVVSGRARFWLDGELVPMEPGEVLLIGAGVEHWAEPAGDEPVLNLDVFAPPRSDYDHLLDWMRENR